VEECTFAPNKYEVFGFELFKMMRQCGVGNIQFLLNFAADKTVGMGGKQQLHDAKARFRPHR